MDKAEKLTALLKKISSGEDPRRLRNENIEFLSNLDPQDIAQAQGRLIESGLSVSDLYSFVNKNSMKGFVPDQVSELRKRLTENHIIRILLAEHEFVLCFLADLQTITLDLMGLKEVKETSSEFRKLHKVITHLHNFSRHMDFEDDVLFARIKKKANLSFMDHFKAEHVYLKIAIQDLNKLVVNFQKYRLKDFKVRLSSIEEYLSSILREHIFLENNILFPLAYEACKNEKGIWTNAKQLHEEWGYSMFD